MKCAIKAVFGFVCLWSTGKPSLRISTKQPPLKLDILLQYVRIVPSTWELETKMKRMKFLEQASEGSERGSLVETDEKRPYQNLEKDLDANL